MNDSVSRAGNMKLKTWQAGLLMASFLPAAGCDAVARQIRAEREEYRAPAPVVIIEPPPEKDSRPSPGLFPEKDMMSVISCKPGMRAVAAIALKNEGTTIETSCEKVAKPYRWRKVNRSVSADALHGDAVCMKGEIPAAFAAITDGRAIAVAGCEDEALLKGGKDILPNKGDQLPLVPWQGGQGSPRLPHTL